MTADARHETNPRHLYGAQVMQALLSTSEIAAIEQEDRWMHPKRILLATDLEDLNHTLPTAIQRAKFHDAQLPCPVLVIKEPSVLA